MTTSDAHHRSLLAALAEWKERTEAVRADTDPHPARYGFHVRHG